MNAKLLCAESLMFRTLAYDFGYHADVRLFGGILNLIDSTKIDVTSFAFGRPTLFLENHPQMPSLEQGRSIKDSFRDSDGTTLESKIFMVDQIELEMGGQESRMTQNDKTLLEYSFGHVVCHENESSNRIYKSENSVSTFEGVIFTAHIGSYNIHHFFLEVLPVLWQHRNIIKGKTLIVTGSSDSRFVEEIVKLLDLELKIQIVPIGSLCRFMDSLYLDFIPFRVYPTEILNQIKSHLWEKLEIEKIELNDESASEVLYIGRGDLARNRRKIVNEDQLIKYLESNFGRVRIIRPALMNLEETIRLVGEAKIIAGPTGGALSHLIWARNISQFIEIVPETYPGDTESFEFAKLFSFKYFSLNSRNTTLTTYFSSSDQEVIFPV